MSAERKFEYCFVCGDMHERNKMSRYTHYCACSFFVSSKEDRCWHWVCLDCDTSIDLSPAKKPADKSC